MIIVINLHFFFVDQVTFIAYLLENPFLCSIYYN